MPNVDFDIEENYRKQIKVDNVSTIISIVDTAGQVWFYCFWSSFDQHVYPSNNNNL